MNLNLKKIKFYFLVLFFSVIISLTIHLFKDFYGILSQPGVGPFYGIFSFALIFYAAYRFYKYLPSELEVISRLVFCKIFAFSIVYGILLISNHNINYLIQSKFVNFILESRWDEYSDDDGNIIINESKKIMYPINKPYYETDLEVEEERRNNRNHCMTKGYGVIAGYKEVNMEISLLEKFTLSGFEYLYEIIITSWVSILLSLILFHFEFKHRLLVRSGFRSSVDLNY